MAQDTATYGQQKLLADISVEITASLAALTLSGQQLLDLNEDQVLPVQLDPTQDVELSIGSHKIGRARFVETADGCLGLEIISLERKLEQPLDDKKVVRGNFWPTASMEPIDDG